MTIGVTYGAGAGRRRLGEGGHGCGNGTPPADPRTIVAEKRRPVSRPGGRLRDSLDRLIAASSLVPDAPVLDVRDFAWTATLRQDWRAIRDEALARTDRSGDVLLWRRGDPVIEQLAGAPRTTAALAAVPRLYDAAFAVLPPGAHVAAKRGASKALVTCDLALSVPRDGDARMRLGDRTLRWAEGETLVFDDTRDHELWNGGGSARIVLRLRFARPLRQPGRWVAGLVLRYLGGA
ncbi:aspartyl/asparaginyl beta-hydroxylase domain-containing protein [Sphingomonas sp. MA1305]|uniref:aspartyl/asparaginyl beta-hydroxylase domain-containing protein n=1 Tax=Sphingomonas sp. MA1305 TaxID=2479204 RepID=UPI0018E03DF7|nr:aspartyl/asparaginyl beta-hydroxylase domain-containing protein [Sphingomonas sp. MA1305]MBI0476306.1 aspartyl/asparaginyl beta-hydroxylase domain-containing protein [Sphingomonas sp. MA1305]